MPDHADFHLANKNVVSADFLLLHQAEFAELFKMMISYAGAAETQCTLDFSDADGLTIFE